MKNLSNSEKIERMRETLKDEGSNKSDEELLRGYESLETLASIMVDKIWSMTKEERDELTARIKKEKKDKLLDSK